VKKTRIVRTAEVTIEVEEKAVFRSAGANEPWERRSRKGGPKKSKNRKKGGVYEILKSHS